MGAGSSVTVSPKTSVSFTLNGHPVVVENASPTLSLNEWLRSQADLSGTKKMCAEGGCGCCVVTATMADLVSQQNKTIAINSCLCPLYSVEGWDITTIEGIGSSRKGFHAIQSKVAESNGSQCGYCTPGFVMSMYSLLKSNPKPTKQQVEDNFDGNICRCTGYRPILDAMKSFASDSKDGDQGCVDIEDLDTKLCPKSGEPCTGKRQLCAGHRATETDPQWFSPSSLTEVASIFDGASSNSSKVKLVCGDTGRGVYKGVEDYDVYIDVKNVPDLYKVEVTDTALNVGAAVPLSILIGQLQTNQSKSTSFEHLASHLLKIANVPVRNTGSWAGNVMLTRNHDNFPSDVFTMMAGAGASLSIVSIPTSTSTTVSLWDFLKTDMSKSMILSMSIPFVGSGVVFRSYKVMPRAENAHAYVNATFSAEVDSGNNFTVKTTPNIVFGGIGTHAVSASSTAAYLVGKSLTDINTLKGALETLSKELIPNTPPAAATADYRKSLAMSLFYKFYLAAVPDHLSPAVQSAATPYIRPLSTGQQSYSTDPSEYPVTQPMPKLTASLQASGEAQYTSDIPPLPNELAAAFILTTQANAVVTAIDTSKASTMPGFVKILTAADIPGKNSFVSPHNTIMSEEVFVDINGVSQYAGQAAGLVIADTQEHANHIAQAVTLEYQSQGRPILNLEDAIHSNSFFTNPDKEVTTVGDPITVIRNSDHVISGQTSCGTQYHFHMETQTALVIPLEEGYTVYSATQWTDNVQSAVAGVLGLAASSVDVSVKRIGGAYGSKITRANLIAAACALGAHATQRPVRMHMDIDTNMKLIGKRFPYLATYQIGCTKDGVLNGINVTMFADCGWCPNDHSLIFLTDHVDNAYHCPNWLITTRACKTNTASNTACRSPGTLPAIFIMESMIDHMARALGMDVETVKRANLYKQGQVTPRGTKLTYCNISALWDQLEKSADVANRKTQVAAYNKANRWRKRGLTMMPLRFGLAWNSNPYTVLVSVYADDGTVAIAHGGVEVGQGINTKVAQVAAKTLGVPVGFVKVKSSNSLTNPNGQATGGSIGSELNCLGTLNACKILNGRIQSVRSKNPGMSWPDLVQKCYLEGVDLSAKFYVYENTGGVYAYNSYGATVSEVEVDVLTGQTEILRVDILYDCGESINPDIDIGQVEGAFVMGLGYWLTEKIIYDQDSGQQLTHNTWEYKPPSSKDIPIDFRVQLLKNAPNPIGVLGSKASGEPPQCMSCSVLFAAKRAIESARQDAGNTDIFPLVGPATVEDIQSACLVNSSQFTL